ncbi:MAG: hypothetical protein M0Z72_03825 [Deltaproteobacteria bacterium]|nr:hypothetical protein [Deltaproteobacteria bacterium]
MKKFIISTVFTVAAAFIFMVSFSMVSGITISYASSGSILANSGKVVGAKVPIRFKGKKKKSESKKSKKTLGKIHSGAI